MRDVETVGGKNASLGETLRARGALGSRVPGGFATTAHAYREFLAQGGLAARIRAELARLDVDDVARRAATGARIRQWILETPFPPPLAAAGSARLRRMSGDGAPPAVAVRSSATAEDLPEASFAGQQESFLNVSGEAAVLEAMRAVFASLYSDRAIAYRVHQGFAHDAVALSAGVQHMVRSDVGASGVMFTLDTDSGFREVVFITASWGLGETVVQGAVNPDEFYVYKPALRAGKYPILRRNLGGKALKMVYAPQGSAERVRTVAVPPEDQRRFCLSEADLVTLARQALVIEEHYGRPMDIEWARDGASGEIFILQARPETVQSRAGRTIQRYALKGRSRVLATGRSVGQRIRAGVARLIRDAAERERVQNGEVLDADVSNPDWEPLDGELKEQIRVQMAGYASPVGFYVEKLAEGIAQIAAAFAPAPVIVRLSDFKSNEYANLIGGSRYEPQEENPMLGFRGASRYVDESFRPCFELECQALKRVRETMGLTNVEVMVPFVRSVEEARQGTQLLAQNGLRRGENGLRVIMMCELPTNALLAESFLEHFDGMSIGSNDMTQLTLGLDRDSAIVARHFDERDEAVRKLISMAIGACRAQGKYVGICGQGPSDHPDFARWLVEQGIDSLSLTPDTVVETWLFLAQSPSAARSS